MTPAQALNALTDTTDYFLKHCSLVAAGDPGASRVTNYGIHYHPSYVPPPDGATVTGFPIFKVAFQGLLAGVAPPVHVFPAHSVQMVNYNTLAVPPGTAPVPLNGYTLGGGGPALMVTGQLSGCVFCILPVGNTVLCAHVRPTGIDAKALQTLLMNRGRFVGHPGSALRCFGRREYPEYATVVGVRKGAAWQIWAQVQTGITTVTGAHRIF
jgi:hypothetical protein